MSPALRARAINNPVADADEIAAIFQQPLSKQLFLVGGTVDRDHILSVFGASTIGRNEKFIELLVEKVSKMVFISFYYNFI